MQRRMKNFQLTPEQVALLLERAAIGHIATTDADGFPYCVPVHFVVYENRLFFHGLGQGEKLDNIARDDRVCFSVYEMSRIVHQDEPEYMCNVNTEYESAVIRGHARPVEDPALKRDILISFVHKYAPEVAHRPVMEHGVGRAAVVEVLPERTTGKYYIKKFGGPPQHPANLPTD